MNIIRLINDDNDLLAAQDEAARLSSIADGSLTADERDRLDVLEVLIRHYEDEHYPLEFPDPIEAVRARMADLGLQQADLLPEFGNKTTASQMLSRTRSLTLPVIRRLAARLGLPVDVLTQEYTLAPGATTDEPLVASAASG